MTCASWDRSRRLAAAASAFTVIAVILGALLSTVGTGVPEAWWPHTAQAFATGTRPADQDPCALIVGPGKAYCERGTVNTAPTDHNADVAGAVWRLVPAGAGVAALVAWRRRNAAGRRRR